MPARGVSNSSKNHCRVFLPMKFLPLEGEKFRDKHTVWQHSLLPSPFSSHSGLNLHSLGSNPTAVAPHSGSSLDVCCTMHPGVRGRVIAAEQAAPSTSLYPTLSPATCQRSCSWSTAAQGCAGMNFPLQSLLYVPTSVLARPSLPCAHLPRCPTGTAVHGLAGLLPPPPCYCR